MAVPGQSRRHMSFGRYLQSPSPPGTIVITSNTCRAGGSSRENHVDNLICPVVVKADGGDGLVLDDVITDFPKRRGASGTVDVVVLVEPVAQHAAGGPRTTDLDTFAAPSLLAMENAECCPADSPAGGLAYCACKGGDIVRNMSLVRDCAEVRSQKQMGKGGEMTKDRWNWWKDSTGQIKCTYLECDCWRSDPRP